MAMASVVGTDTDHHLEWAGDGTLVGDHRGRSALDGVGDLAGAGDLLGMEAIDLGVAGMAVATGDQAGTEMDTGVVVIGAIRDLVTLQVDLYTEITIIRAVHHQEPGLQAGMTITALPEIPADMIALA